MTVRFSSILVMFLIFVVVGCNTISSKSYDNFDNILESYVGKPYEQAFAPVSGLLRGLKPDEIHSLENGNELHVYKDYFKSRVKKRGDCDVYFEVDSNQELVVATRSKGEGCWMPY